MNERESRLTTEQSPDAVFETCAAQLNIPENFKPQLAKDRASILKAVNDKIEHIKGYNAEANYDIDTLVRDTLKAWRHDMWKKIARKLYERLMREDNIQEQQWINYGMFDKTIQGVARTPMERVFAIYHKQLKKGAAVTLFEVNANDGNPPPEYVVTGYDKGGRLLVKNSKTQKATSLEPSYYSVVGRSSTEKSEPVLEQRTTLSEDEQAAWKELQDVEKNEPQK